MSVKMMIVVGKRRRNIYCVPSVYIGKLNWKKKTNLQSRHIIPVLKIRK